MNDFILTLMMLGAMSSGANMPFWATANRFGLIPEANGGIAYVAASSQYDPSKTIQWHWGASLAAGYDSYNPERDINGIITDGFKNDGTRIMLDQLYAGLRWKMFSLDLGMMHRDQGFLA